MDQLTRFGSCFSILTSSDFHIHEDRESHVRSRFGSHVTRVFTCGRRMLRPRRTSRRLLPWRRISATLYAAKPTTSLSLIPSRHPSARFSSSSSGGDAARAAIETVRGAILTRLRLQSAISCVGTAEIKADINSLIRPRYAARRFIDLRTWGIYMRY